MMNVLVIGSGGREHALAWQAARSAGVEKVFVAPGNAGTAGEPGVENIAIAANDLEGLVEFAREQGIGLTMVQEILLAHGFDFTLENRDNGGAEFTIVF